MKKYIVFLLLFVASLASAQGTVAGLTAAQLKTFQSLNNVENTALSTWGGSGNIVTLGTVVTGVWNGTAVTVTYGGTGAATLASNGILYGNGTGAIQALAVNSSATNKLLTQSSSGAPAWNTLVAGDIPSLAASIITSGTFAEARGGTNQSTYTTGDMLYASGANTLAKLGIGSSNTILSSSGTAPQWVAIPGPVTTVITADQAAATNNAYINNKASTQCVITLPSTAAVGTFQQVIGLNVAGWKIAQNASQKIHVGGTTSTTGTGGYISSNEQWDVVYLVCVVANSEWDVIYSTGTITVN